MYDGTPRASTTSAASNTSPSTSNAADNMLDSSDTGSESDFDITRFRHANRILRDLANPRRLRWPRMATSPNRHPRLLLRHGFHESDVPYIEADEASEDMGTERLPPLRELIWRRYFEKLFYQQRLIILCWRERLLRHFFFSYFKVEKKASTCTFHGKRAGNYQWPSKRWIVWKRV